MIQLIIMFSIAVAVSLGLSLARITAERTSMKIKEKKGDHSFASWLFLYPVFNIFSRWLEKVRLWFISVGNFILRIVRFIIGSAVLITVLYLIYRLIKWFFSKG